VTLANECLSRATDSTVGVHARTMTDDFKLVAAFPTPVEASLAKSRLEEAGIRAFLDGEAAAGWLWHLSGAIGGVKVLVPAAEVESARGVLAESANALVGQAAWTCQRCGVEVDAEYEVCWSCGATPDGTNDPQFQVEAANPAEDDEPRAASPWLAVLLALFPPAFIVYMLAKHFAVGSAEAADEPPSKPSAGDRGGSESWRPEAAEPEPDPIVMRAWRSAVMGIFLLPPLLNLYSCWLLFQHCLPDRQRMVRHRRRIVFALVIDLAMLSLAACFLVLILQAAMPGNADRMIEFPLIPF